MVIMVNVAEKTFKIVKTARMDAAVDIMIQDGKGYDFLQWMRLRHPELPVILTASLARMNIDQRLNGLTSADDTRRLVDPSGIAESVLSLRKMNRKDSGHPGNKGDKSATRNYQLTSGPFPPHGKRSEISS
ncbi:MAG TPA: hypothetical protein VL122_12665 [Nitrospirota bacterium]|nr:hypothetical protein [Nitrospirota bacterium]